MDVKYHKRAARVNLLAIFFFSLPFFDNENEGAMDIDRVTFTAKALHQRTDRIFTSSANVRFHLGLVRLKLADFLRRNLSFFFFLFYLFSLLAIRTLQLRPLELMIRNNTTNVSNLSAILNFSEKKEILTEIGVNI